jgi:hypothetical protein
LRFGRLGHGLRPRCQPIALADDASANQAVQSRCSIGKARRTAQAMQGGHARITPIDKALCVSAAATSRRECARPPRHRGLAGNEPWVRKPKSAGRARLVFRAVGGVAAVACPVDSGSSIYSGYAGLMG